MKRIKRDDGWDEVTTKQITIENIWRNFQTNEAWVSAITNGPISPKGRQVCKCCGSKWENNKSDIALAFTDKGNQILCQTCTDSFEEKGIKVINKDR